MHKIRRDFTLCSIGTITINDTASLMLYLLQYLILSKSTRSLKNNTHKKPASNQNSSYFGPCATEINTQVGRTSLGVVCNSDMTDVPMEIPLLIINVLNLQFVAKAENCPP